MAVLLRAENVVRRLEGEVPVTLLNGVSLEIREGEFIVIMGPSGSGKSSLLYLLGLLDRPTEGRIWLKGMDTSVLDEVQLSELRLSQLGFVFQFHFLLPEFTALENVTLPLQRLGQLPADEIKRRGEKLLTDFGLQNQMHKLPRQMSGGQCQRVAIARALANNAPLILADEPTGNLDSASGLNVRNILRDIAHQQGRAVVVVTHEETFSQSADRLIRIVDGRIQ